MKKLKSLSVLDKYNIQVLIFFLTFQKLVGCFAGQHKHNSQSEKWCSSSKKRSLCLIFNLELLCHVLKQLFGTYLQIKVPFYKSFCDFWHEAEIFCFIIFFLQCLGCTCRCIFQRDNMLCVCEA